MQDSFNNAASLTAWRICPGDVLTMKLFDQMRITKAAEYGLPVELIGGDAAHGTVFFVGTHRLRAMAF
jgi:hypothetical protein